MSDKSFGDHSNRNIVKNPLLSTAVTGLSLEDLTHKAVLLPVTPSLGQITRPDQQQGSEIRTLAHADHETSIFPSGDAFPNVTQSNITQSTNPSILDGQNNVKLEKNRNVTQSKASIKSDDDFDVNEYIARLQGSRYVSAPLHSHLKEDQKTNLETTEENLEEINLNDSHGPIEVQQSLTADIAQNFSQLPTVLPHVASAVFSSFSNMLSYKSRDQTPDYANVVPESNQSRNKGGYDEVQFQRPDVGVPFKEEDYNAPKEVVPPPKEPPIGGATNFRIATKKKYAQIPGLSSGDAAITMAYDASNQSVPFNQNVAPTGHLPPFSQNVPFTGQNVPAMGHNWPPIGHSMQPTGQSIPPISQNISPIGSVPHTGQSIPLSSQNLPPVVQSMPPVGLSMSPVSQNVPIFKPNEARNDNELKSISTAIEAGKSHESNVITQNTNASQSQYIFNSVTESHDVKELAANEGQPNLFAAPKNSQKFFTPIEHKEPAPPQNIPPNPNAQGSASIIPPPPMFSNLPGRNPSQPSTGKSVLPPSVARRISANQPIIKPAISAPSFSDNIFVPAPVSDDANESSSQTEASFSTSAFMPRYSSPLKPEPIGPPSSMPPPTQKNALSSKPPPPRSQPNAATPYFIPPNEEKSQFSTETSLFFTPKEITQPETSTSSISPAITPSLTRAVSAAYMPEHAPPSSSSNIPTLNIEPMTAPPSSSIFTSENVEIKTQNSAPQPNISSLPNIAPPPIFYNPLQHTESSPKYVPHPITQMPPMATPDPIKPVVEPPKAAGNVNFRMIKKRPQYYAGPIEGVGDISNNVKPIIAPVIPSVVPAEASSFQGALFTPDQPLIPATEQYAAPNIKQASVPFDISRPMENVSSQAPFDISQPNEQEYVSPFNTSQYGNQSYGQEYNTAFDMSRAVTDTYDPPKQESRGFGIIGSLKSKLSSIDINKIQSTVTTFFDPAYNEAKVTEPVAQDNASYGYQHPHEHQQQLFGQPSQEQSDLNIFVPSDDRNQYGQFKHAYEYNPNNQYYQPQGAYAQNQGQNLYSTSSYFTNSNFSTDQIYSGNPLYDNSQRHMPTETNYNQESISEKETGCPTYFSPNAFTQEAPTMALSSQQQTSVDVTIQTKDQVESDVGTASVLDNTENVDFFNPNLRTLSESNVEQHNKAVTSSVASEMASESITYYNPNAYVQQDRNVPVPVNLQQPYKVPASFSSPATEHNKNNTAAVSTSEKSVEPVFYNPNTFFQSQQLHNMQQQHFGSNIQQNIFQINKDFTTDTIGTDSQTDFQPSCDSVLNTIKYNTFQMDKDFTTNNITSDAQSGSQSSCDSALNTMKYNTFQRKRDFTTDQITSDAQTDTNSSCDSVLNTMKYKRSNIQAPTQQNVLPSATLLPASSFFDSPQRQSSRDIETDNKTSERPKVDDLQFSGIPEEQFESKSLEINKILAETPIPPIGIKSKDEFAKIEGQIKERDVEKEKLIKEKNLIESLSKEDMPILGVSTVPLFGLSAMVTDKCKAISETEINNASLFDAIQPHSFFEGNTAVGFLETPEKKLINEKQAKEIPLVGLSITDIKNVLIIEPPQEKIGAVLIRNSSSNKLENHSKAEEVPPDYIRRRNDSLSSTSFQEKHRIKFDENVSEIFFKHPHNSEHEEEDKRLQKDDGLEIVEGEDNSELNICETCREVKTPDCDGHDPRHKDTEDVTTQIIENITSRMQLSNPLTVPLTECDAGTDERSQFYEQQLDEITHIAEDTIETLQVQSATELLDDVITSSDVRNYGWSTEDAAYCATAHVGHDFGFKIDSEDTVTKTRDYSLQADEASAAAIPEQDYEFKIDPNAIGFFGDNSLFFDNLPTNASDEIKAEIKHSHEDIVLPRQMSIPTAPPAEDDTKSDETGGLDVHSIEQDAKMDFPLEEEFVIEPSETDDDKIEFKERKRSSEESTHDTFTNRVERFKKAADNPNDGAFEQTIGQVYVSPPMSMASYFDTGNYAVEAHYRNSLTSPTSINTFQFSSNTMIVPPGFEEEYVRRMSVMSISSGETRNEPYIPDTSTQTKVTSKTTFSSPQSTTENVIGSKIRLEEHIETAADVFDEKNVETGSTTTTSEPKQILDKPVITSDSIQAFSVFDNLAAQPATIPQNVPPLADPMNFFSANQEETKPATESAAPESSNRLASYFSMPPAQPDHSKSFFELSESQNHYRHKSTSKKCNISEKKPYKELSELDDDTKSNITDLMKDLTSPKNIQEQIVRTVNYFTVEYDNDIKPSTTSAPINVKIFDETITDPKADISKNVDSNKLVTNFNDFDEIIGCKYCLLNVTGINSKDFKVRTAVNETSEATKVQDTTATMERVTRRSTATNYANYDVEGQSQNSVSVSNENRSVTEYTPVKHHWFYRVDVEEKSVWRGFSLTDSRALEESFHSPDLNENTLVATDGGRFDVNVLGRLRIAVYWKEKPTNVRRCSWFYKGTTDARYVPYTEAVADKLEEEYRHGVTTGEWHRKLGLPNSEMVIMHGPSVMVHFLHSGTTDAFSTPPNLLGKRVYRNPPKIKVARDQPTKIDHLVLLVHGAGEYKRPPYEDVPQATSRPRVVRRGYEESEIEDTEPSGIDHLLLLCHGVGSACDMRFRSVEEVVEDFRATSLQLLQSHYKNSYDNGTVSRVEVLPISWHEQLHSGETGVDRRLSRVTLDSIPRLRAFTNHTVLDVLFYTSPVFHQTIIDTVCSELNRIYSMFKQRNPGFKGEVSLGGHSLGSVILYDLLCYQLPEPNLEDSQHKSCEKTYVPGTASTGQAAVKYPQLEFAPAALYALGSPIAIFECIRGVEALGMDFALPTCKNFFNIFHPYDPIAYRIEPLINPQLQGVKPSQIPHHKGRKRMHLELKDTMARVGADLKQKLVESVRTTWNKWKASPPTDGQLEKVVEEEMEKEQLYQAGKEDSTTETQATPEMLGQLNCGRRIDYVLQEAPLEMINEYLFAMSSHVGYWESEDTMLLMLREIYSALGVQPDSTVPQQSMTVERTRTLSEQDDANLNNKDYPSTSRGGT